MKDKENNNETVAEVCGELKEVANGNNVSNDGLVVEISQEEIWSALDRIEAAHKREIAAKDAEIARLRTLVKETTDKLASISERGLRCDKCEFDCDNGCVMYDVDSLVARARKETKDGK